MSAPPKWTLTVDLMYSTIGPALDAERTMVTQTSWTVFELSIYLKTLFRLRTEWQYVNLSDALSKINAMATMTGFDAANVRSAGAPTPA